MPILCIRRGPSGTPRAISTTALNGGSTTPCGGRPSPAPTATQPDPTRGALRSPSRRRRLTSTPSCRPPGCQQHRQLNHLPIIQQLPRQVTRPWGQNPKNRHRRRHPDRVAHHPHPGQPVPVRLALHGGRHPATHRHAPLSRASALPSSQLVFVTAGVRDSWCSRRLASDTSSNGQARPLSMRFQYSAGRPYFLRSHMSRRGFLVLMSGMLGVGVTV